MTTSLLKSPGLFSVFRMILKMLYLGWFPFDLLFPSPRFPAPILWWVYRACQFQLVSTSLSCSIVFQFSNKVYLPIALLAFFQFYPVVTRKSKIHYSAGSLFFLRNITRSRRLAKIRWFIIIIIIIIIIINSYFRLYNCLKIISTRQE